MIMKYIDTHCHINDDALFSIREEVISRANEAGCLAVFNNGDSLESFYRIQQIHEEHPEYCFSVLGIHPEYAVKDQAYQEKAFEFVKNHLSSVIAIGEIGLDYHYDKSDETVRKQKEIFRKWIRFAKSYHLPVVVHSRDAAQDTFDIIKEELPEKVDLHCYSGSYELFKEYLKLPLEFHIGIGGVVTFKNAKAIKEIVSQAPIETLLTETDSPYLAPTPHRGERNEPCYIPLVIQEISRLRNEDEEVISQKLLENGERFYGHRF